MKDRPKVRTLNKNILISLLFIFSSSLCFAQGDDFVDEDNRDIEELEGKLQDFKNSQQEVLQELSPKQQQIQLQLQKAISSGDEKLTQELTRKLAKDISATGGAKQMQKMVDMSLKSFQSMSKDQLRTHLLTKTAGNPVGVIFNQYPKLLDYFVKVLRDPIALPQFFSILNDKMKLMIFFGINLFLFFVGLILKKAHKAKDAGLGTHFKRWLLFFSLRLIVFLGFFHTEVGPFFFIAKDTFL